MEIDAERGTLTLKLGPSWGRDAAVADPGEPYNTMCSGRRCAAWRLDTGRDDRYPACHALLRGDLPAIAGVASGAPLLDGPYTVERAVDLALRLDGGVLPIQGPPGTGKTYAGAHIAVALMAQGRRVGVTAPSHKAIHNLLEEIERMARAGRGAFRGYKRGSGRNAYASPLGEDGSIESVDNDDCEAAPGDVLLLAGTSWLFARDGMEGTVDTLIVDEAGQVSLADALAVGTSAANLVLLGDPQQLAQVAQGGHPEQTAVSALGHMLGEDRTMPPERGLFIDVSRRMHPDVCRFVSEISYGGELHSLPECANQRVTSAGLTGAGLRAFLVEHAGNRRESVEEARLSPSRSRCSRAATSPEPTGVIGRSRMPA